MRRRNVKLILLLLAAVALTGIVLNVVYLPRIYDELRQSYHMASLAGALDLYYRAHKSLPESLSTVEATGLLGSEPYRGPHGAPVYLPVLVELPPDGLIIAVSARAAKGGQQREFVRLNDAARHSADYDELVRLLAEDDEKRRAIGETRLWKDIAW